MYNLYRKIMIETLHFFNYNKIENEKGSNHKVLNSIDLVLTIVYFGISIWKLKEITFIVLIINVLTLLRFMVGNIKKSINLRDEYKKKYMKKPGLEYKSTYDYKLIIEACVIMFSLFPFWLQGIITDEHVIRGFAGIIIALSFFENYINIQVELFKASIEI